MATYYAFTREEFESKLKEIVELHEHRIGDATEKYGRGEHAYEVTTKHPQIRMIIYSSLSTSLEKAAEVGKDAVRLCVYCKYKGKEHFKQFKTLKRVQGIYKNFEKSLLEVNDFVFSEEVNKWIYAIMKNN